MTRFLVRSIIILGCVLPMAAQQAKVMAPHKPIPPKLAQQGKVHGEPSARSLLGGLWMVDPNTKSTLYLKNNVETSAIVVTPVLHLSNGAQYTLPDVNLEPAGTALVSISDGLQSKGIASYAPLSGYVELRYNWPWDALCATIRNLDTVHSTIFMYSIPSVPMDTTHPAIKAVDQVFEGLWWKQEANVTGFVSLLNTSSQAIRIDLQLLDNASNVFANHATTVSPHGMKRIDLEELLTATSSEGGIRVTYSGQKNDLQIYGGLQDQNVGYSAKLPFVAVPDGAAQQNSLTIAELGLMAGAADPMMSFPVGTTFTPYSVLRNTSDAPILVTPTLWWMQGGAPHSASSPALTLLPHQSRSLDVMSLISSSGLKNFNGAVNLMLDVQGKTSGLITVAGSVDQTNTYVFEVIPKAVLESASKSLSYWSTGNGDDTMVTLWNPADEAQDFSFKLIYTGGHYAYPIHIGPRESRTFNISEIIHSQIPDAEGNTVPVSVQDGSATISGSQADNQHILVAMDAGTYNVKKATCGPYCQSCDGVQSFWVDLGSFSVGVNQAYREFLKDQWLSGQQHDLSSNSNWSSSNTSKATVSGGNVTGVSAGSAVISANYTSSEPVGVQNLCQGSFWSCPPGFTSGGGSGTGTIFGISSVAPSTFTYGGTGTLSIVGFGFNSMAGPVTIKFDDPGITASGSVADDSHINGTYQIMCGAIVGLHSIWISFGQGGSGATNSLPISVVLPAAPTPTIKLGGNSISGTQSVVVGQQIALSGSVSLPACMSKSSEQWTPSSSSSVGTPIGGYAGSATSGSVTSLPSTTSSTYTFYWVYPATSVPVTYQYSMSGGGSAVSSPVASATFNITGPSGGTMTNTHFSSVTVKDWSGTCTPDGAGPYFVYGSLAVSGNTPSCTSTGTVGISFSTSGYSNFSGGDWWFVQLLNSQTITVGTSTCTSTSGKDGPYPNPPPENDSPFFHLLSTDRSISRSFNAAMYLMWKSSTANSIPVPLGYQVWGFSGSANCSASCGSAANWIPTTSGTPGPVGTFVQSTAQQSSFGYPKWTVQTQCQ